MYPLRPKFSINSVFLLIVILGKDFSRFASSVSMRSGFPKINREEIGEYKFSLPPQSEQEKISLVIQSNDNKINAEQAYLKKLQLQKKD
jgi:type I restriction enzyme S subunit